MITKQALARTAGRMLALTLLLTFSACRGPRPCCEATATAPAHEGAPAATGVKTFAVRGVVREVRDGGRLAVIRHEEIPGYMAAMTMTFDVRDPAEMAAVSAGDRVAFRMTVTETDGWIDQIQVLERGVPEEAKPEVPGVRIVRQVEELEEGDRLPDYPFVTESRQAVRLDEFRGRALGFTFIYTRCPYPTFCPRQSRQFAEAVRQLKERLPGPEHRWHLLSISFDPAHDTPPVLQRYARQYDFDPAWWNFCTGAMIEIDAITEQFGMLIGRDGETFSHNVRTVVVEPSGRIRRIFVGNEWTVEEFVAEMVAAAAAR
ncbi:MAG: SCO family protein [Verrucomicrobia bacterium]|nr:SCO family protein [Verrucomicrobiota bacterium]